MQDYIELPWVTKSRKRACLIKRILFIAWYKKHRRCTHKHKWRISQMRDSPTFICMVFPQTHRPHFFCTTLLFTLFAAIQATTSGKALKTRHSLYHHSGVTSGYSLRGEKGRCNGVKYLEECNCQSSVL